MNEDLGRRIFTKVSSALEELGTDGIVCGDPGGVTYLSGVGVPFENGTVPFEGGPPLALLGPRGVALVAHEWSSVEGIYDGVALYSYESFRLDSLVNPVESYLVAVREAVEHVGSAPPATDGHLPAFLYETVRATAGPRLPWRWLERVRAKKEPEEVEKIQRAADLADLAHDAVRSRIGEGVSELELWSALRQALDGGAGSPVSVIADLVSGAERTAKIGGHPGARVVSPGDPLIVDIAPVQEGYWADSCATYTLGSPKDPRLDAARDAAVAALEASTKLAVAGAPASSLDQAARNVVRECGFDYSHHTGHGVGTSWHEEPRIYPHAEAVLEPGMTIALEPGAYGSFGGVRVEWIVEVTSGPARVMSGHDLVVQT